MTKKKFPEGFFTKDRATAKPKYLNAEDMLNNYEADCEVYENSGDSLDTELWMIDYLKNHSSTDVQPIVHCVKCKYRDKMEFCILNDIFINEKDFCSKGDKLDGDEHE
jgi:hypothetical protein